MCSAFEASHAGVELMYRQKGGTLPAEPQAAGMIWYRAHDLAAGCCAYHIYSDDVNAIIPIVCAISYVSYDSQIEGAAEEVLAPKQ